MMPIVPVGSVGRWVGGGVVGETAGVAGVWACWGFDGVCLGRRVVVRRWWVAVVPRWPQDHAAVDPFRRPGY